MSEADRYFIKKGFSKVIKQGIEEFTDDDGNYIHFDLVIERFTCNCYLSAKELQAINKKVEELRMDMSNKTSDKNVANIEELIQEYKTYNDLDGIQDLRPYIEALENLLAELEQKDKRIQELEKESRKKSIVLICYQEKLENSIPTQVVIDKIKELKKRKNKYEYETQEIFSNAYYDRKRLEIIHKIDILQELLEGEK